MRISIISRGDATKTRPDKVFDGSFEEFAKHFVKYTPNRGKHDGYFVRGELTGSRANANLPNAEFLILDGDSSVLNPNSAPDPKRLHEILKAQNLSHFIYTTHSYAPPEKVKWRCIIPCLMADEAQLKPTINRMFDLLRDNAYPLVNVTENSTWSQPWFLPNRDKDDGLYLYFNFTKGQDLVAAPATPLSNSGQPVQQSQSDSTFSDLTDKIRQGHTFHEPLLNISYQLIKQGMPVESTIQMLTSIMEGSAAADSSHPRHKDWMDRLPRIETEYVAGAVRRCANNTARVTAKDIEPEEEAPLPSFPENLMETWPEPWPMIWKNFARLSHDLNEALLIPTVITHSSYMLMSRFRNKRGRRPNFIFLNLSESTGGKDVNSRDVLRDMDRIFSRMGSEIQTSPFAPVLKTQSSVTSDSTFLESFDEHQRFYWINTESTNIWHQMATAGNNAAVKGLSDKLIQVVDGNELTGKKRKQGGDVSNVENPTAQCLFYAQPDTIRKYVTMEQVDSGLIGRCLISIVPRHDKDIEDFDPFASNDTADMYVDDDFHRFYTSESFRTLPTSSDNLSLTKDQEAQLTEWFRKKAKPYWGGNSDNSDTYMTVLKRIATSIEQLYTVVLGMTKLYDRHKGIEMRKEISIQTLLPLFEYWFESKVYTISNLVEEDIDPLYTEIAELLRQCISGKYKFKSLKANKLVQDKAIVPLGQFIDVLMKNKKLLRKLECKQQAGSVRERIDRLFRVKVEAGEVFYEDHGRMRCVGLRKSGF